MVASQLALMLMRNKLVSSVGRQLLSSLALLHARQATLTPLIRFTLPPFPLTQIMFFSTHWFACIFYLIARIESAGNPDFGGSWVGQAWSRFEGLNTMSR